MHTMEIISTAKGDVQIFENPCPQPDDPYLEKAGWYFQAIDLDDGPVGPHDSSEIAKEGAVATYGDTAAPGMR